MTNTQQVLENHLKTFGEGDLDGIMSDFSNEAMLIIPEGVYTGKSEIRDVFRSLLKDLPPGSSIQINQQIIKDDVAYLIWQAESDKVHIPFATDTIWVQNGKIVKQTFAANITRKD